MINDKTVKSPCKFAIKDEIGDLICGNEYSENLADFCSVCSNYVPDYQRSDNVSVENVKIGSEIEMEEMNLTDEIIKALEFKAKFDAKVAYVDCCACKHIRVADILDLIRSLQQRVSILEADNDDYKMKIAENELVSIDWHYEQVLHLEEEIERLTEEKYKLEQNLGQCENGYQLELHTARYTIAELQKQVDELKERCEIAEGTKNRLTIFDRISIHDKAVKDTAKEIFILAEDYNCGYETDMDNFMKELKERYGVEVE